MADDRWTDEDDAAVIAEGLPPTHPIRAVKAFIVALQSDDPEAIEVLRTLVTPESLDDWGDFAQARTFAFGQLRISTRAVHGIDAPDVSYVKFAPDEGPWVREIAADNAILWATLVWRPETSAWGPLSCWRIHRIGEPAEPSQLPRTAAGFDPRNL